MGSVRCVRGTAGAALPAGQGHGARWPFCDQRSLGCGLFDTSRTFFSPNKFGVARLPKDSGASDNFLPELLASAGDFFMGDLSQPSLVFSPLHRASLITPLCSSALHFPLLSLRWPTMAPTLHTATAFWLLLPWDLLPFVSTLLSLIQALPEGQAYLPICILSPAVGKQLLLSFLYFLSVGTFQTLSPYNFFFFF